MSSAFETTGPSLMQRERTPQRPRPWNGLRKPVNSSGWSITGRAKGEADRDRRRAIVKGGL